MPSSANTPATPARPGRLVRAAAWVGGALLTLGLVLYAAFPWLAPALAAHLAPVFGVEVLEVELRRPGLSGLTVERLRVVSGRLEGRAEDVFVAFRPAALLRGRLQSVAVQRLALRVAQAPGPTAVPAAAPAALPAPDSWLAALPAGQVSVAALTVSVPALAFRAAGGLELDGPVLLAHLTGRAPAAAEGMTLAASLTRDGRIAASLTAPGADGAFVALTSAVEAADGGDRLGVWGSVDLRGFPLALARSLAGVPPGEGRIAGSIDLALPWPPPDSAAVDWDGPTGAGDFTVDWRPDAASWRLEQMTASWELGGGRLAGGLNGTLRVAGQPLTVQARLREWRLPAAGADGAVTVALPVSNERPVIQASWRQAGARLTVDGLLQVADRSFDLLADHAGIPAGDGRIDVTYEIDAPWPLAGDLTLSGLGLTADGTVGASWQPAGGGPGLHRLDGRWDLAGAALAARAQVEVGDGEMRAGLTVALDRLRLGAPWPTANGSLDIGNAGSLAFEVAPAADTGATAATVSGRLDAGAGAADGLLGGLVTGWPGGFDVTAGSIDVSADLMWSGGSVTGAARAGLRDVSAYYQAYRLSGLTSVLQFEGNGSDWRLPVTPLRADRLDAGVELQDIDSGIGWRGEVVEVQATTLALLGGRASIEPFDYHLDTGSAAFLVTFDGLDLARLLALQGDQVRGSGTLDGGLPVRVEAGQPSISGGQVHADAPGGTLRVSEALASGAGQPGLDFALRALQNFDYSVLTAEVDYAPEGDLTLAVHLEGHNPAIEKGRPIHYNVTVNQNLPVLLESLRLQDDVTRRIERRLNN
jgi:hypothetical protein